MFSRSVGFISMLAVIFAALNSAELLTVLPPKVATFVAIVAALTSGLSRALVDRNGNGVPDVFEAPVPPVEGP